MKVAFIGNQDNHAYRLAGWLRQAGIDAHVFLLARDVSPRSRPELVDRHLEAGRGRWPDWQHEFNDAYARSWMPARNPAAAEIAREFDVVVTSGPLGLLAGRQFRGVPLVHLSLGSEVTRLPLLLYERRSTLRERWASWLARRALDRADAIISAYSVAVGTLKRLGHARKVRLWGFPEDLESNLQRVDSKLLQDLNARYAPCEAVFVWLSRLNFLDQAAPEYKGAERFLEAFARIVHHDGRRVRAVVGLHGNDVEEFQRRVEVQGLAGHVDFVPHLPYWELLTWLSIRNAVVFDLLDVRVGTLGGLTREALSVGALVAMAIDRESMDVFYGPDCPLLDALDAARCYAAMQQVLDMDAAAREALSGRCQEWALRCLDQRSAVPYFLRVLREAVYTGRIEERIQTFATGGVLSVETTGQPAAAQPVVHNSPREIAA